jgi:hypothetical protein
MFISSSNTKLPYTILSIEKKKKTGLMASLGNLSEEDFDAFASAQYTPGELGLIESQGWFAYTGYNPKETLKHMSTIEPDPDVLMVDVKTCAYFVMHRGNKPSKAMTKMEDDGKGLLQSLMKKYKIIQTPPTTKNDLTMLRIAGIVPIFCAQISADVNTRTVGSKPAELPKALAFSSGPALIPKDREDLYQLWLEWAISFNQVIAGGKSADKVDFFGRIVQDASYLTEEKKLAALDSLY